MVRVTLNGNWDFMPVYDIDHLDYLPEIINYENEKCVIPSSWRGWTDELKIDKYNYEPMNIFDYPQKWNMAKSGVLHTVFSIPKEYKNMRIFLNFEGIAQEAYIYLNGMQITSTNDMFLPLHIEISGIVKETNDLHILCTSFDTVIIQSGQTKTTALRGSWYGQMARGIWQEASLCFRPAAYISDIEIVTSVRHKSITIYTDVTGTSDYIVKARIFTGTELVKEITGITELYSGWETPILWDTENPHLYTAKIELIQNKKVIDTVTERFGFREFWSEGQNFILNGTRINLRGDSWHFQGSAQQTKEYAINWYKICKENGINSVRLHAQPYPRYYLDAADEMGILIVDETAIYGSAKTMDAAHPQYIENCRAHIKRLVKRDKNHPSVVIWSLQNEMRWVDGRDEYKKFIPELIEVFHKNDRSVRLVSLDGDNRLIDKEHTEVASLHYNIDGTIDQWDRKTPLTIGEHGGLWYICPQNSSMYMGMGAYLDSEECIRGISIKEQLFMEFSRRKEVSGISSFNFAHYFANSMPRCDINVDAANQKIIKKYSLTIDNGLLPKDEYPVYSPNAAYGYAHDGMNPVTVFIREYNHSFYDDMDITRTLEVYNETLSAKKIRLEVKVIQDNQTVYAEALEFLQNPGDYITRPVTFTPGTAAQRTPLYFECKLYHGKELKFTLNREYSIYPHGIKTALVTGKNIAFWGNKKDFEIIKQLSPNTELLEDIAQIIGGYDILIIGSDISDAESYLQPYLYKYLSDGGSIIILEQFSFALGSMTINKKDFLRAHASDYSHPILEGIGNDDLMYWHPEVYEDGPKPFIYSAFEKPLAGNFNMILECSLGDFGDGGDLWTPLLEYTSGDSTVVACQLDIMSNCRHIPQAMKLLSNIIKYVCEKKIEKVKTCALGCGEAFFDNLFVDCKHVAVDDLPCFDVAIIGPSVLGKYRREITIFVENGGTALILPLSEENTADLRAVLDEDVQIIKHPVYQLKADYCHREIKGISIVDLFGFDKVTMSPRDVTNELLAYNAISGGRTVTLVESVEGNIWEDLYVNKLNGEYCKRALTAFNRDNTPLSLPYAVKKALGKGKIIVSQIKADFYYYKTLRFYTHLLSNLGCTFHDEKMNMIKGDAWNSVEIMMALPYLPYQDYTRVLEYYTDPQFSLNNLGEGLYGWMKKYERDVNDGYLRVPGGGTILMTCFVHTINVDSDKEYIVDVDSNCDYKMYINGSLTKNGRVILKSQINRMFILVLAEERDLQIRPIFKNIDGSYATDLQYRLTVDEIDPK